ncbi:MAG: helix-turn-helix domain-containing protein [Terriglobales bacterium]
MRRLAESGVPVLAFAFQRHKAEDWAPEHRHARGQLLALTRGLLVVEAGSQRWMFPSQRCAWIPPQCLHAARSAGGAAGAMLYLSATTCRGLPKQPCLFSSSELLFAIVHRALTWNPSRVLSPAQKRLVAILRDELRTPEPQPLRLPVPRDPRLAKVAHALLENIADDRTLDEWGHFAGMARRTLMRAFLAAVGMPFGRWRQQARLFAALEMLAEGKSVTETAIAVGYDSVSAFIQMFRTMLGATPQAYLRLRPVQPPAAYSSRKAAVGSTRMARRAGM